MDDNSDVVICWMTENEKEKEASSERKKGKKKPAVAVRYIACFFTFRNESKYYIAQLRELERSNNT